MLAFIIVMPRMSASRAIALAATALATVLGLPLVAGPPRAVAGVAAEVRRLTASGALPSSRSVPAQCQMPAPAAQCAAWHKAGLPLKVSVNLSGRQFYREDLSQRISEIVRGEGCWVWDVDGHKMIDGVAGLWCCNAGHGRPVSGWVAW